MENELGIKYEQWGSGDHVIVLLHYFGGSAKSWEWTAKELNEYTCIALNLPGFGGTEPLEDLSIDNFAKWILETMVEMGVTECTLVGHSISGKIALKAKEIDSDGIIERLILVAPSPPSHEPMPKEEKKEMLDQPDPQQASKMADKAVKLNLSEEKRHLAQETPLLADHTTWEWWIKSGMNENVSETLHSVDKNIYVLASEDDPVIAIDQIRKELDASKVIISHPTSGHLIPLEDSKWLAGQIRAIILRYPTH